MFLIVPRLGFINILSPMINRANGKKLFAKLKKKTHFKKID